ncbi:MAG: hypothetical protein KAJ10_02590, partial [Thermodesulfovibrionia bacterium]|nr:hypothetical protein [Thermodesulfovibrionia bacterium]
SRFSRFLLTHHTLLFTFYCSATLMIKICFYVKVIQMLCPKCNEKIEDDSTECPFCGIVIARYRPSEPFRHIPRVSEPEEYKYPVRIPYFKIGILIAGIFLLWVIFKPKYVPETRVISFKSKETVTLSCDVKERCVVAYLAPW